MAKRLDQICTLFSLEGLKPQS